MQQSTRLPTNPPETPDSTAATTEQASQQTVDADELLELLGDEYTYRVFEAVVEQSRTGRELIEATDASKATVYRRLDELEDAGLVESTLDIASDGNHRKRFHAVVTAMQVSFGADGASARLESENCPGASAASVTGTQSPADD
jgi:DNA-binding transcriptional ArsR family regulator